jgi:hypothetical protein
MNLIQYDNKDITLTEINNQCKHKENVLVINDNDNSGIVVLNKTLLEKMALSSFLSKGIEDIINGNLVDGPTYFRDFKSRLKSGNI